MSLKGQQATLSDPSRVFELNVCNRKGNPAAGGQKPSFGYLESPP